MTPPSLVLVVPCSNEASRLDQQAFLDFLASHVAVTLIFVDDGSVDSTFEILRRLEQAAPNRIRVMRLEQNRGKAEAVRLGILEAIRRQPQLVGFWDADLSTPLGALDDFTRLASERPDIELVLGSRVLLMGRDIRRTAWRHYVGRVFATAASLALGLPVYDTQCGAKVFRVNDAVARVFETPFRSAWIFDVELLARYLSMPIEDGGPPRRARIYELALPAWHEVPGSKLRLPDFVRSMFELMSVWRDRRSGRVT
ncbi:MAG: glycosyltransferase [Acidobacteria bacterium]|nr:glycosyltransferase [Acidobacteriota bacterium]